MSTNETNVKNSILFGNPVNTKLNYHSKEKVNSIEIYSIDGKLVKKVIESNSDVTDLLKVNYLAKVKFKNGITVVKKTYKELKIKLS